MYVFIDSVPVALMVAESLHHTNPIILYYVCTDSEFLINVTTKWIRQWSNLKWYNADGTQ